MTTYFWQPQNNNAIEFDDPANWLGSTKAPGSGNAATFSDDIAEFDTTTVNLLVSIDSTDGLGGLQFDPLGVPLAYTVSITAPLSLYGGGIINNSSYAPTLDVASTLSFIDCDAADAVINVDTNGTVAFVGAVGFSGVLARTAQINNNGDVDFSNLTFADSEVTFDSISGSGTFNLGSAALFVGLSNNVRNSNNYTVTGNIVDGGAGGSLDYIGTGTLTLAGDNAYTGGTTIAIGATLQLGNGGSAGSLAGAVTDNGAFVIDETGPVTLSGNITGTGILENIGSGTTILTGANSYGVIGTASTDILAGTVQLGNGGSTGSLVGIVDTSLNSAFAVDESGTYTFTGVIEGAGSFEQLGSGTTILTGDDSCNTTISGGTLQLGNGGSNGVIQGSVTDNGNLAVDKSGVVQLGGISGTGSLQQIGSGQTQLVGSNTYSGATDVNAGTLTALSTDTLSANSAVTVASGATLSLGGSDQQIASLAGAGLVANGGTLTEGNGANTTFGGDIALNTLIKVGTGTLTLTGTDDGNIIISAGTLQLGNGGSGGSLTGSVTDNATLAVDESGTRSLTDISGTGSLELLGSGTTTLNGATYLGATDIEAGTLEAVTNFNDTFSANSAVTVAAGATLDLGFNDGLSSTNQTIGSLAGFGTVRNHGSFDGFSADLTVGDNSTNTTFGGIIEDGAILGGMLAPTALTKVGAGTLTLSGANSYSGATDVNAGTLAGGAADAFSANSAVTVASGATLDLGGFNQQINSLGGAGTVTDSGGSNATLIVDGGGTFSGVIEDGSSRTGLTKVGGGTLTLSGANTYSGATDVAAGTLSGGVGGEFSANSAVTVAAGATLDLGAFSQQIASLAGAGIVTNTSTLPLTTLIEGNSTNTTFSGVIENGSASLTGLTKVGSGTLTLTGVDAYTGGTTLSAGTLELGNGGSIAGGVGFDGAATLRFDTGVNQIGGDIGGATTGDAIDLGFETFATGDHAVWQQNVATGIGTLTLENGSDTALATLTLVGDYTSTDFTVTRDSGNGTLIELATNTGVASNYVWSPSNDVFGDAANWSPDGKAPGSGNAATFSSDAAEFASTGVTNIAVDGSDGLGAFVFDAGAPAYTFTVTAPLSLYGAGIIDNSSNAPTLQVGSTLSFLDGSAADAVLDVNAAGTVAFSGLASSGTAQFNNNGDVDFSGMTTGTATAASISGSGTYHLGDVALTVGSGNANSYTVSGNIVDGGAGGGSGGSLTYAGTGTLTLAGNDTYTGGTAIDVGATLQLGNGGSTGSLAGSVTDNGAFVIDESGQVSLAGNIGGAGSLTQLGTGTTILTGADSVTGGTTISAGTLELGNGGSITGNAMFADAGVPETLRVDTGSNQLGDDIVGFALDDNIDLSFLGFSSALSAVWQENAGSTGGTLALDDNGATLATLNLSGQYDSSKFSPASDGHGGTTIGFDDTPTAIASNPTVDDGQTVAVDPTIFTVSGSGISEYEVWFSAASQGAPALGSVSNDGSVLALNKGVYLTSLSGLDYTGGPTAGTDEMWLRALNGSGWSSWVQADITDPGGSGPITVTANNPTVIDGQTVAVSPAVFSVGGGGISQYEVWFSAANQGAPALGSVTDNGTAIALNQGVYLNSLSGLNYTGGATAGTDEMWLRASNGSSWSSWVQADITDPGNVPPPSNPGIMAATVTANNPTVDNANTVAVDPTVFTVSGSGVSEYEVWFSAANQGAPALGSVTDNGNAIALDQGVYLTTLNGLDYTGGATAGTDEMWLRAYDGNWSNWVQADIADPGSSGAPEFQTSAADDNVLLNGAADQQVGGGAFSSVDGDPIGGDVGTSTLWSGTGSAGWLDSHFAPYQSAGAMMAGSTSSPLGSAAASGIDGASASANQANAWSLDPIGGAGMQDVLQTQSLMAPTNAAPAAQLSAPAFAASEPAPIMGAGLLHHA